MDSHYDQAKRIDLSGCVYHLICRADQDYVVFTGGQDKERFDEEKK